MRQTSDLGREAGQMRPPLPEDLRSVQRLRHHCHHLMNNLLLKLICLPEQVSLVADAADDEIEGLCLCVGPSCAVIVDPRWIHLIAIVD